MNIKIFCYEPPSGRCLILAKKLEEVSTMGAREALSVAQELFAFSHNEANPVVIRIKEGVDFGEFLKLCSEFKIITAATE